MQVALISYTPEAERTVAVAAKLSTSSVSATELSKRMSAEQVASLLNQLLSSGHLSPFEHASFTFAIDSISRVTSHQLVRHRIASYTQQSQRYVSLKKLEYITPATISAKPELNARYHDLVAAAHQLYCQMLEAGIPAEDARYVLPQALHTRLVMTMNARELMNVCALRLCLKAQWEIVELFEKVKEEVNKIAPLIAAELKPKCYNLGYCDERTSCGLFPTLKKGTSPSREGPEFRR